MELSRHVFRRNLILMSLCVFVTGCTSFVHAPGTENEITKVELPQTVGEATRPQGLGSVAVESVGLVTGLHDTGSDPPQSPQRNSLLQEMRRRKVDKSQLMLAKSSTSLVLVRALLPPGVRKGDRIDVEVRVPSRSKTGSLEGGWLMETELREVAILNNSLHAGHVRGIAEGRILVDSLLQESGDDVAKVRGTILGGGVATKSRPLGLTLRSEHHSVSTSKLIGAAINRRFDTFVRGQKRGAAKPKTDNFIELVAHPRYRNNLIRYLRVIEQIQLRESGPEQLRRLEALGSDLLVPSTSSLAALRMEGIGEAAEPTLLRGLDSPSAEVRFYAAEALAYLDVSAATPYLGAAAGEPAFRSRALLALGAMSSVEAHDQLTELLHVPSAETRYGAFRALQNMNPRDPMLGQEVLGARLFYHEIASSGEPMIHVSRTRRPEIVTFGPGQRIETPLVVFAGRMLMIKGEAGAELKITRYTPGDDDQILTSPPEVSDLIRNLIQIGATYPEIVNMLRQTQRQGCLHSRLVFDAIPQTGRKYRRGEEELQVMANKQTARSL